MPYLMPPNAEKMYDFQRTVLRVISGIEVGKGVLPRDELLEVLASSNRDELFIGGVIEKQEVGEVAVIYRGDLVPIVVPLDWFKPSGDGVHPDFTAFTIMDYGHTVKLGEYEAATHAVLYEFDREYHRRAFVGRYAESQKKREALRTLRGMWKKAGM